MTTEAHGIIKHALKLHQESVDRLRQLEGALDALNNGPLAECHLQITPGQPSALTGFGAAIPMVIEQARPVVELALLKEREAEARMRRKLDAARAVMQQS